MFLKLPKYPKYKEILQVGEKTNHISTHLQVYHKNTSGIKGGTSSKTRQQLDHYPNAPWDWNMYLHLAAKFTIHYDKCTYLSQSHGTYPPGN